MNDIIIEFINKKINTGDYSEEFTTSNITNFFSNESAIYYLLIWPIFEQKLFGGEFKLDKIDELLEIINFNDISKYDTAIYYFHNRYQNKEFLNKLINYRYCNYSKFKTILSKSYSRLTSSDKYYLLIFVIFRFRNNIFHGNKEITNWSMYREEILHCLNSMVFLINDYERIG